MGAPLGNQNASKGKMVYDALRKAIVQNPNKLEDGIEKVLSAFQDGEPWAAQFVRDTLDGKPAQSIDVGGQPDNPIRTSLTVEFK